MKDADNKDVHLQWIRNALGTINQIDPQDRVLAGYLLDAEKALRSAINRINVTDKSERS